MEDRFPRHDTPLQIHGMIKLSHEKARKYDIPPGIYPVIYFEMNSVEIPIDLGQPDWIYIDRDDIEEWVEFEKGN